MLQKKCGVFNISANEDKKHIKKQKNLESTIQKGCGVTPFYAFLEGRKCARFSI